jgi:hypothetical protein
MSDRRSFTFALAGGALVSVSGCGGGSDKAPNDNPDTQNTKTESADFALIGLPFSSDYLLTTNVQENVISLRLGIVNGTYTITEGLVSSGNDQLNLQFDENARLTAINNGNQKQLSIEYKDGFNIIREYDNNGIFKSGLASFKNTSGRLQSGLLVSEAFKDTSSLKEIIDIQDVLEKFNALNTQGLVSASLGERMSSMLFRNAYAAGPLEDLLQKLDVNNLAELLATLMRENPKDTFTLASLLSLFLACGPVVACHILVAIAVMLFMAYIIKKGKKAGVIVTSIEGNFYGDDFGSYRVNIGSDRSLNGTGYSNELKSNFSITGNATPNGSLSLETRGSAGTGATFTGSTSGLQISGTWNNASARESGNFRGHFKTNITGPKLS